MNQENNPQQPSNPYPPNQPLPSPQQPSNPYPPNQPQPPGQFYQPPSSFPAGQTPGYMPKPSGRGSKKVGLFIALGLGLIILASVGLFVLYSVFSRIDPKLQAIADSVGMECERGQLRETVDLVKLDSDINVEDIGLQDTPFICTWEDVEITTYTRSDAEILFPFVLKAFAAENSEDAEVLKSECEKDEGAKSAVNTAFSETISEGIVGSEEYVFWLNSGSKTQEFRDALEGEDIDTSLQIDICEIVS